jgi:hypothetical protein
MIAPPSARIANSFWVRKFGAFEDDPIEAVNELLGGVLEHRHLSEAGVVDEVVDRGALPVVVDLAGHLVNETREGLAATHIEREGDRRSPRRLDRGDGLVRAFGVGVVGEDHSGAALGDLNRSAVPNPRTGSDDDRELHGVFSGWHVCSQPAPARKREHGTIS